MSHFLLEAQAWWDTKQFDPQNGYQELSKKDKKARHIQLHIAKAALKLAASDQDPRTIAGDIAMYRSQLINTFRINVEHLAEQQPDRSMADAQRHTTMASGELAYYLEPKEHGRSGHTIHIDDAVSRLHLAGITIAHVIGDSLNEMHRNRLEILLGEPLPEPLIEAVAATTGNTDD